MARFVKDFPLDGLRGAEYNPRRIDQDSLTELRRSLEIVGVAKPIIVSGELIVAGHQRTKSLRALGWTHAPSIVLNEVTIADEVRFNQLHNGTDFDSGDEHATVGASAGLPFEFEEVPASDLTANRGAKKLNIRYEICDLLLLYGNWGCSVATMSGEIIHAAQYAMACQMINMPIRVYRVPDEMAEEVAALMGRQYGVFSYDHLSRKTYIQTFAQPFRGRGAKSGSGCSWQQRVRSQIYEYAVEKELKPGERLLDFGCGQADYLKFLQSRKVPALGIEFFFRAGGQIDAAAVHRMIDSVISDLDENGLFDVVVADSVINSVDTKQAEADVMACLNAFCRPGGRVYFSGRTREYIEEKETRNRIYSKKKHREVEFLDEHGFSGTLREGEWFYQLFHRESQVRELAARYIGEGYRFESYGSAFGVNGVKTAELEGEEIAGAIAREFDLMWPGGRSVGRAQAMLAAWRRAAARSAPRQTASSDK